MTGYDPRAEGDWDTDPHAPGNWLPSYGGSLRHPRVRRTNPDDLYDPPEQPDDRAMSAEETERMRARVRAGRCPFRANECGWGSDCRKHRTPVDRAYEMTTAELREEAKAWADTAETPAEKAWLSVVTTELSHR